MIPPPKPLLLVERPLVLLYIALALVLAGCASGKSNKAGPGLSTQPGSNANPGTNFFSLPKTGTDRNQNVTGKAIKADSEVKSGLSPAGSDYVIRHGDVLEVKFFYYPDLNEKLVVRPDGKISLQMVDEITAAGMRPAELAKVVSEKYARVLQQPQATVIMREFSGMKVYVGGEVYSPRELTLSDDMTALQAIMGAGGFNDKAKLTSVIIVSRGTNNLPTARRVDLAGVLAGNFQSEDPLLHPFDVVIVPKTFIAQANKFVEQYIKNMIPGNLSGGFSYTIWRGTQLQP